MLPSLLALVLVAAPHATGPSRQVSWDSAVAAARGAVERGKLDKYDDRSLAERVRAAGLAAPDLRRLLEDLVDACATSTRCSSLSSEPAVRTLATALGAVGTTADASLLLRLDARGVWDGERALEEILTRDMAAASARARCGAPGPAELAAAREQLADFVLFRHRAGRLVAERPTDPELDDLAYFFAAIADNGPRVGAAAEGTASATTPAPDPERERLAAALTEARKAGDVAAMARHGRGYLQRLGFPGPIDRAAEDTWAWGGARYSYVLRDLALASEILGDHALAGQFYRRADPGGGACGTSVSTRWADQVRGAIRSAEQTGDCRAAVAERLLDIDGPPTMWKKPGPIGEDYGPARLAAAGFDVPRLYRGALLTVGRDADPSELRAALGRAPMALRSAGLARLARLGPEDWEARVHAVEGLADTAGRAALPDLTRLLAVASPALRPRLLAAIGALAERPFSDPCDPDELGIGGLSISSQWERKITSLGSRCETSLRLHEAGPIALSLVHWLRDQDPDTREAAAVALGKIGHKAALPALRALKKDPHRPENVQRCDGGECHRFYPVREAAQEAIATITERSAGDARWPLHDPKR